MTFFADPTAPFPANFAFSTLILPAVSAGSIGQLAIDLIIASCKLERVGFLEYPEVVPVVGNDCFSDCCTGVVHVGVEVYQDLKNAFTVIQQRSPILKGFKGQFVARLTNWILQARFAQVFLLTGADAARMTDEQLSSPGLRYVCTSMVTREQHDLFARVHWTPLESAKTMDENDHQTFRHARLYNSGISRRLLTLAERRGIAFTCLIMFTTSGNTISDAIDMATALDRHLGIVKHTVPGDTKSEVVWQQPHSWQQLYGTHPYQSMYF